MSSLRKNSAKRLPWWLSGKESTCNAGDAKDLGSIPELGRIPGRGNGNSFQCSCLGNTMDRGAWWATVNGVVKIIYKGDSFQIISDQLSGSCPYLILLRAFPDVHVHLVAKMDSSTRVSGKLSVHIMGWHPLHSLTPQDPLCACMIWEVSLTPRMIIMWPPYSETGSSSSLLLPYLYLEVSTGDKFQLLSREPSYLLSQNQWC